MRSLTKYLIPFLIFVVIVSCNRGPYATTNKSYKKQAKQYSKQIQKTGSSLHTAPFWAGTTNFNLRKPNIVVIHHTAQKSCDQTLKTFTLPRTSVSAHYVICKDGTIHHMLNDYLRAWHGGIGRWGNITDLNSSSIGIEIDNDGFEPFTDMQINSLLVVLDTLKKKHSIPVANFIGHSDIAPTRKVDPNVTFPWKQLADKGFGLWYNDTTGITVPQDFNNIQALRIIGYDVKDTSAAIAAFKRKFMQQNDSRTFNEGEREKYFTACI